MYVRCSAEVNLNLNRYYDCVGYVKLRYIMGATYKTIYSFLQLIPTHSTRSCSLLNSIATQLFIIHLGWVVNETKTHKTAT